MVEIRLHPMYFDISVQHFLVTKQPKYRPIQANIGLSILLYYTYPNITLRYFVQLDYLLNPLQAILVGMWTLYTKLKPMWMPMGGKCFSRKLTRVSITTMFCVLLRVGVIFETLALDNDAVCCLASIFWHVFVVNGHQWVKTVPGCLGCWHWYKA